MAEGSRKAGAVSKPHPPLDPHRGLRVNAWLARALGRSRRDCDTLVKEGRVTINSVTAGLSDRVREDARVALDGRPLSSVPREYIALNKPPGVITAVHDERERTVVELLPPGFRELFPVGRLDRDTRGLLLLTNDGDWSFRILHPSRKVPREYHVKLDRPVDLKELRVPVELEDGVSRFDDVRWLEPNRRELVAITLHEGRKRQIRRVFRALGYRVLDLVRTRVGSINLGSLGEGKHRRLTREEIESVGK
jgi:23S rRNA pseudouridine2605 synthase